MSQNPLKPLDNVSLCKLFLWMSMNVEARYLVNVSNDAWFEDSREPHQHHAIARMRALESGRYMVRATNTGVTAIIDPQGEEIAVAPQFETTVLSSMITPMRGATPYVIWGDWMLVELCVFGIGFFVWRGRKTMAAAV
ncbi:MAG: nitrilase-related carbon-nitrogen hydrolase [Gammaproteobacteria bacterium]|nr:nitrilase-related carbon-nitrogen hydrolase [Gammaproteobacteria bacterium]